MYSHVLLINTRDEKELVYKITGVISKCGLNIINNNEFVEREDKRFFMRSEIVGKFDKEKLLEELKAVLPEKSEVKLVENKKKKIVVLATKEHHCLGDLLLRESYDEINAEILAVIANHNDLKPLVDKFSKPFYWVSTENKEKHVQEKEVLDIIDEYNPDYIVLAKYMRILSPDFVEHLQGRIINIHHSFLPAFIGANPYKKAFIRGVKIIGATAHFVSDDLDDGPIITQEVISINHEYTANDMKKAGREAEKAALAKAIKLVFEEKVFISGNKTIILG